MANYLTTDTDLTAVANAIRTKGGTSAQLTFPQGFVDAIAAIQTGGGGDVDFFDYTWPSGSVSTQNTRIYLYALYYRSGVTAISAPNATNVGEYAFSECSALTSANLPSATSIPNSLFRGCRSLTDVTAPLATSLSANGFMACASLRTLALPSLTSSSGQGVFDGATSLTVCVFGKHGVTSSVSTEFACTWNVFRGCSNITALDFGMKTTWNGTTQLPSGVDIVLRSTTISTLSNASYIPTNSTIYVPSSMLSTYGSATNWSSVNGTSGRTIVAIEGSIYETQYADGTSIT